MQSRFVLLALGCLLLASTVTATDDVSDLITGPNRKLLGACKILGQSFKACVATKYGVTGITAVGSKLSIGVKGGSKTGWVGWTVGRAHQGSSAVFNIQGSVSTRTMNGKSAAAIQPPSQIPFKILKKGLDGGKLAVTFALTKPAGFTWAMASGPGNLIQHSGIPKQY